MKLNSTLLIAILFSINVHAQWTGCSNGLDNYVWGSCVYNNELYACGNFESADNNPALGIAKWNGTSWSDVGGGFMHGAFSNVVRGLIVFNNELIAGGYVDSAGGNPIHKVAKWDGASWSAMGTDCPVSTVNCFAIHNGELYVGGEASGAVKVCVAKWTGTNWLPLDTEGGNVNVWSMISYNGHLYAGGHFANLNNTGAGGIARWDGSTWSDIGSGVTAVNALAVFQNKLFIGGSFTTAGGVPANNIVAWDGTTWTALQSGVNTQVQSLCSYGPQLFVGGTFWMVNGSTTANRAAMWDGSSLTVLGTDLGSGAKTICVYNNELYYGGEGAFNNQHYFARWTGGTFSGIHENTNTHSFTVFPNPSTDQIFVHSKGAIKNLIVEDVSGRRLNVPVSSISSSEFVVDVSELGAGVYLLSSRENALGVRIVVQH